MQGLSYQELLAKRDELDRAIAELQQNRNNAIGEVVDIISKFGLSIDEITKALGEQADVSTAKVATKTAAKSATKPAVAKKATRKRVAKASKKAARKGSALKKDDAVIAKPLTQEIPKAKAMESALPLSDIPVAVSDKRQEPTPAAKTSDDDLEVKVAQDNKTVALPIALPNERQSVQQKQENEPVRWAPNEVSIKPLSDIPMGGQIPNQQEAAPGPTSVVSNAFKQNASSESKENIEEEKKPSSIFREFSYQGTEKPQDPQITEDSLPGILGAGIPTGTSNK